MTSEAEGARLFTMAPGLGYVNRTLDRETVDDIGAAIRNYQTIDRFELIQNTNSVSLYNTLSYGPISWYSEAAYKSSEAFFDPEALLTNPDGSLTEGRWVRESGTVFYSSLSYAGGGLGVTVEGKRTENFDFRIDPQLSLLRGLITFIPIDSKVFASYSVT